MKLLQTVFVLTLAALLLGGVVFVAGQAIALTAGNSEWLTFLNDSLKNPMCIAASICAIAGFLLSYKRDQKQSQPEEARSR
ncbi:hypothetical protein [Paenarthrobacter aurescens]|uniref:hypothetical protein n=1 Tax=Paenarthrobacter aurescens TaxID=43663 RepID=UPI0035E96134